MNKGVIRVYEGTPPSSPDFAPTGIQLAEISNQGLPYQPATKDTTGLALSVTAQGILTMSGDWRLRGLYAGTPGWFRWNSSQIDNFTYSQTVYRADGLVGIELFLTETGITPGMIIQIDQFQVSLN